MLDLFLTGPQLSMGKQEAFEIFIRDHEDHLTIEDNKNLLKQRSATKKKLLDSFLNLQNEQCERCHMRYLDFKNVLMSGTDNHHTSYVLHFNLFIVLQNEKDLPGAQDYNLTGEGKNIFLLALPLVPRKEVALAHT